MANEGHVSEYSKHWYITGSLLFSAKYEANCSAASVLLMLTLQQGLSSKVTNTNEKIIHSCGFST